jgi:hypothetical protein
VVQVAAVQVALQAMVDLVVVAVMDNPQDQLLNPDSQIPEQVLTQGLLVKQLPADMEQEAEERVKQAELVDQQLEEMV